ncbi:MAG: TonB-dependent receptor [Campylobacterota bacterium]|nr:TonB-dependent receptor [Campylobacterota bacterium]
MKKIIPLSLLTISILSANEIILDSIGVESTYITEVAQNAKTSADLADAISKNIPSVDMTRRSGISNDIYIRGQKRDNISVAVDGTKVCGACPNRMDPPVSHVLASQIEDIEVIEGPYDVENFGTLSGGVKIKTKQPSAKEQGEVELGFGSWGYKKVGLTASGGTDKIKIIISGSMEESDQYEDGNGDTLTEQAKKNAPLGNQYQTKYEDMKAYEKKSLMFKSYVNITDEQELSLSYTANRSDDVLYANTPMDAILDDSDIYSIAYDIDNLTPSYTNLNLQYYYSKVDHPMSTEYRNTALVDANNKTNHMNTTMGGFKVKNKFLIDEYELLVGFDGSKRTWDGDYYNNVTGARLGDSIDGSLTKNIAIFSTVEKTFDNIDIKIGARYDSSDITSNSTDTKDYNGLNANILTTLNLDTQRKIFLAVGQAYRLPDGRELYFKSGPLMVGSPDLDQTKNQQIDLGYEMNLDNLDFKIKGFYSKLSDFIYYQDIATANRFQNIDATIYGSEISTTYYMDDALSFDASISYKRGEKDEALAGQTDKDLADMAPLRGNITANYEYMMDSVATLSADFSDTWDKFDEDNGEQKLDSWAILNFKVKHAYNKQFDFIVGVNNIFDKTYAVGNTSKDLTLVASGLTNEVMLLNEPGRYLYTSLIYKF